ncbi:MAG: cupin domain-containing protein [Planctomycetota bacterium]|jgi:mannose-6-phosphate isomerase-like protein (cupin superfamily)|nr:cupin domain-containing protein [Planctomycetota bacterium]
MQKVNIFSIEGTEYPAGRRTRVILGDNGALPGQLFCQGYVEIHPGGSIPGHRHETVESYLILEGEGNMTVAGETLPVKKGDCVFVEPNQEHGLDNSGSGELRLVFVYAPKIVVDHWAREMAGELK